MSLASRGINSFRAGIRAVLRHALSQQQRTELKRLQGLARKRFAPVLSMVHGNFGSDELREELVRLLPPDFEVLMVHSSYDGLIPMYKGTAAELLSTLISVCGPQRTLVMPSFVMGGRTFDTRTYFQTRPFDVRRTPSEMGLLAELFRRTPGVLRSLHPTASICALGPLAEELTAGHQFARTGFSPDSPFGVMTRRSTAILGIGVEYFRCLTHAHTAAHALADEYPIKFANVTTTVTLVDYDGGRVDYELGLPDRSRKLDLRVLWTLLSKNELVEWRFHGVPMFIVTRAGIVTERLIEAARRGITIYGRVPVKKAPLPESAELQAKESVR
jgi:aminoglycoside N3'-acetyltransferase